MDTKNISNLIPLSEAATLTGYSVGHIRRAVKSGQINGWRRGKRLIVVDRDEVVENFFKRI